MVRPWFPGDNTRVPEKAAVGCVCRHTGSKKIIPLDGCGMVWDITVEFISRSVTLSATSRLLKNVQTVFFRSLGEERRSSAIANMGVA